MNNYKWEKLFRQVGTIINEYVPELYELDVFDPKQILFIIGNEKHDTTKFLKYPNLRSLFINDFIGIINLIGLKLHTISLNAFDGDLEPLRGMPLHTINLNFF